jgi:hypothetical protein
MRSMASAEVLLLLEKRAVAFQDEEGRKSEKKDSCKIQKLLEMPVIPVNKVVDQK